MTIQRITKRTVDALKANGSEFTVWDDAVSGFGVRVRPTGAKSYVVVYRAGSGRGAPVRRYTIATVGKIAPERARARAKVILGSVAHGHDPAGQKTTERGIPTVAELADRFMAEHVEPKRKGRNGGILSGHSRPHGEAGGGHHQGRQIDPATGRPASFLAGRHALPGQPRAGGGRKHVRLCRACGNRSGRHQSGTRHRQVQGKPPRAVPDRRGASAARQRDPGSRNHRHPLGGR